jgi:hypothetical protein
VADAAGGDHCRVATFSPPVTVNAVGAAGATTVAGGGVASEEDEPPHPENDRAVRDATANMVRPDTNCCQREGSVLYVFMINLLKKHTEKSVWGTPGRS